MAFSSALATAATAAAVARGPEPKWASTLSECDEEKVPSRHWYLSVLCTPCAAAQARSNVDQSHVVFNILCVPPPASYSYIRQLYGISGSWTEDCTHGVCCSMCSTRQAYSESHIRKQVPGKYGQTSQQWSSKLLHWDDCGEVLKATFCPCIVAYDIHKMMQSSASMYFDYCCVLPTSMYGTVRNTYGIGSEWPHPVLEDVAVGCVLYPCALNRALREAAYQKTINATNAVAGVIGSAQAKVQQLGARALQRAGQLGKTPPVPPPGSMT